MLDPIPKTRFRDSRFVDLLVSESDRAKRFLAFDTEHFHCLFGHCKPNVLAPPPGIEAARARPTRPGREQGAERHGSSLSWVPGGRRAPDTCCPADGPVTRSPPGAGARRAGLGRRGKTPPRAPARPMSAPGSQNLQEPLTPLCRRPVAIRLAATPDGSRRCRSAAVSAVGEREVHVLVPGVSCVSRRALPVQRRRSGRCRDTRGHRWVGRGFSTRLAARVRLGGWPNGSH